MAPGLRACTVPAIGAAVAAALVLFPLGALGELFAAQKDLPSWYLLGGGADKAARVPAVVAHNVLDQDLLDALQESAAKGALQYFDEQGEMWLPLDGPPRNFVEQAVLQIAAADLDRVLPKEMAARVTGVAWRINIVEPAAELKSHAFHFDCDEATRYLVEDVPLVPPLLSTVTYLTDSGAPTVVLDYTMLDSPNVTSLPSGGFMVMPRRNKHLAFDSRLLHGVIGELDYQQVVQPGSSRRIILGMNFWEEESVESQEDMDRHKGDEQSEFQEAPLPWVDHTRPAAKLRAAPVAPASEEDVPVLRCTEEEDGAKPGVDVPLSVGGLDFKHAGENEVRMRVPIRKLLALEEAERGRTARFELCADGFDVLFDAESQAEYPPPRDSLAEEERKYKLAVADRMLRSRCSLFGASAREMVPPQAAAFCSRRIHGSASPAASARRPMRESRGSAAEEGSREL